MLSISKKDWQKQQWQQEILTKATEKYGELKPADAKALTEWTNTHWKLNQEYTAEIFGQITAVVTAIFIGAKLDLTNTIIPKNTLISLLGRSSFICTSFLAGSHLSTPIYKLLTPALYRLKEHQLEKLFKKADDINSLLVILNDINLDISSTIHQSKKNQTVAAPR